MSVKPVDDSKLLERITIDPDICHGKPCVRGLRYPVQMILELLSGGITHQEILADYDDLEPEDILAVLAFAARLTQVKRVQVFAAMKFLVDTQRPRNIEKVCLTLVSSHVSPLTKETIWQFD